MDEFCALYWRLDATTKTTEKVAALGQYFGQATYPDAAWAIYFLTGQRIKRLIGTKQLREWAIAVSGVSPWLFEECYDRVGDLAETISLLVPDDSRRVELSLSELIEEHLLPLREQALTEQREHVIQLWRGLDQRQIFVLGKLMTGGFRVGVSKQLVIRAIAKHAGVDATTIAHRLMGDWQPTASCYAALVDPEIGETETSKPFPFFLANPIKSEPDLTYGQSTDWIAEWKWDGIRAQLIRRSGQSFIWSRGEELVTDQFSEVELASRALPDGTVIDGELVGWDHAEQRPLPFSELQRRLGRKRLGKKLLSDVPVVMLAFDLLEQDGQDIRTSKLEDRQAQLGKVLAGLTQYQSPITESLFDSVDSEPPRVDSAVIREPPSVSLESIKTWDEVRRYRSQAAKWRAEGLMLKRRGSSYQVGRPVGDWWKWKVDPLTIDAVLIYAQRGHGRRASLYSDYTFAVWSGDELVPFAKAYSGLTDAEIRQVDAFVRKNTHDRFGPVRSVTPELVFELAFEKIHRSPRHKSGVAVRFPRISRWRHDKTIADADHLETIIRMVDE